MKNSEIKELLDVAIGDKDYLIDTILPTLRYVRKYLLSDNPTSKQFDKSILKINQAIATAKFMRSSK